MGGKGSKQGGGEAPSSSSASTSSSASASASTAAESKQPEPQPLQVNSVQLHVYDPAAGSGGLLSVGVHHSGLVVFDTEYTFAGSSGGGGGALTGIYSHRPRAVGDPQWAFREALNLGTTDLTREQVRTMMQQLKNSGEWTAGSYNLTKKSVNIQYSTHLLPLPAPFLAAPFCLC